MPYVPTPDFSMTPAGEAGIEGLGCACGCGGGCGCNDGLGLFDTGMDISGWGAPEWMIVVIAGYALFSTVWTTGQAVQYGKSIPGRRRKSRAKALRDQAKAIESKKGFFG